jgi:hypothetical protein
MSEHDPENRTTVGEPPPQRKPYQTPRLTVYGDLHRIALAGKGGSTFDGGGGKPSTRI